MKKFLGLIKSALDAFVHFSEWKRRTYIHELEDEIDRLAANGSPAAKLQLERLSRRLKTERELLVRPSDDNTD